MLSVCLLYAKLAKVLMTHAQCNSLRHQENSPLALDQTYAATVHMVFQESVCMPLFQEFKSFLPSAPGVVIFTFSTAAIKL